MTQNEMILNHLKTVGPITPIDALNLYGCFRLSGRILNLRQDGYNIKTTIVEKNKKHFAEYSLEEKACN